MARAFACQSCGEEIVTVFLSPGDKAVCRSCGAHTPVPEDAREVDAPSHYPPARPRPIESRPAGETFTAGGVLSETFAVFAHNFVALLAISFLVYLPTLVLNLLSVLAPRVVYSLAAYSVGWIVVLLNLFLLLMMPVSYTHLRAHET